MTFPAKEKLWFTSEYLAEDKNMLSFRYSEINKTSPWLKCKGKRKRNQSHSFAQ